MHKKEVLPIIPSKEMFAGNANAPVELTVFGDYESPETRQLNEVIKEVMRDFEGKVKLIFRHFPLTQIHQRAHKAAEAAIGAGQEGKFWEMHELLMERYHQLGITSLKAHAREAGVVNKRFLEQLMNSDFGWNVQDDLREGLALGVRDVPALLINGKFMERPLSLKRVSTAIQQELRNDKKSRAEVKKRAA
ncbi:MAG: DsbA family protein [Flavisolibacter sp.]